jgi:hypothetical protein
MSEVQLALMRAVMMVVADGFAGICSADVGLM